MLQGARKSWQARPQPHHLCQAPAVTTLAVPTQIVLHLCLQVQHPSSLKLVGRIGVFCMAVRRVCLAISPPSTDGQLDERCFVAWFPDSFGSPQSKATNGHAARSSSRNDLMLPDGDDLLGMTAHTPVELAQVGCHLQHQRISLS